MLNKIDKNLETSILNSLSHLLLLKTFDLHNFRFPQISDFFFSGRLSVIPVAVTLQERQPPLETSTDAGAARLPRLRTRHKHVTSPASLKEGGARRKTRYVKEDLT